MSPLLALLILLLLWRVDCLVNARHLKAEQAKTRADLARTAPLVRTPRPARELN